MMIFSPPLDLTDGHVPAPRHDQSHILYGQVCRQVGVCHLEVGRLPPVVLQDTRGGASPVRKYYSTKSIKQNVKSSP